ncbi:hypothetical protein CWI80_08235 [Pseudidiomarina sediminum]|uniref:Toxin-antitoxin system YwqK family antitoxin n=1 Tax=Pseudidiomarina sediminum TaxID=431675 RepID=A0A432Z3U7_9GAMM|nr:hypothetical protein [Pseudidiomarina sediminum]RUO72529.1 hypothetical protein CWI80_08235 [Pseudidiomarina sediminum]
MSLHRTVLRTVIAAALLSSSAAVAQETKVQRYYFDNDQIRSETPYVDGKRHGEMKRWTQDGVLVELQTYANDKFHGPVRQYHDDGTLRLERTYVHGTLVGESIWYDKEGNVELFEVYDAAGERVVRREYLSDGTLVRSTELTQNERGLVTERKHFSSEGVLQQKSLEANDEAWKLHESYNAAGEVIERREYLEHDLHGLYISRYGDEVERVRYVKGKRDGDYTATSADGEVLVQGKYDHGKRVGKWVSSRSYYAYEEFYNADGQLHGVRKEFNEDGELKELAHYENGELHGRYEEYIDGKLVTFGDYVKGVRQGPWEFRNSYPPVSRGDYRDGYQVGEWRAYSEHGYLRLIERYNDEGRLHGLRVEFDQSGALSDIAVYRNGSRHGKSWSYLAGKPYLLTEYDHGKLLNERYEEDFDVSEFPPPAEQQGE